MTIRAVVFDMGNTLTHFVGDWYTVRTAGMAALVEFYAGVGITLDGDALLTALMTAGGEGGKRTLERQVQITTTEALKQALRVVGAPIEADDYISAALWHYHTPESAAWVAVPGALETLAALSARGYLLGAFSNAPDDSMVQRQVEVRGYRRYLSPVFTSAGMGYFKPRREVFALFPLYWDLPADEIVMVGDVLQFDIVGAQAVGMRTIWTRQLELTQWNTAHYDQIVPDAEVRDIRDVVAVIAGWG